MNALIVDPKTSLGRDSNTYKSHEAAPWPPPKKSLENSAANNKPILFAWNPPITTTRDKRIVPLLRFPFEIREKIYTEILGDQLVHLRHFAFSDKDIHRNFFAKKEIWTQLVCAARLDKEPEAKIQLLEPRKYPDTQWLKARRALTEDYRRKMDTDWGRYEHNCEDLDLRFLLCCQQVYYEASKILWSTNIFSFNDSASFKKFMTDKKPFDRSLMTYFRLVVNLSSDERWSEALSMSFVDTLPNMRQLVLHLYRDPAKPRGTTTAVADMTEIQHLATVLWRREDLEVTSGKYYLSDPETWLITDADLSRRLMLDPKATEFLKQQRRLKRNAGQSTSDNASSDTVGNPSESIRLAIQGGMGRGTFDTNIAGFLEERPLGGRYPISIAQILRSLITGER